MSLPRILISGQTFNKHTGGGITLSNLFKGWPKENLAVLTSENPLSNVSPEICNMYYQLGNEECKWIFPINFFQPSFQSGPRSFNRDNTQHQSSGKYGIISFVKRNFISPIVNWSGVPFFAFRISVSEKLKDWIHRFKPEILYIQVSRRDGILFAIELCDYLKIPSVIHMMDDWPATISSRVLFKNFWARKIDAEFRQLLNKVDMHLSISEAMSKEYFHRYSKKFIPFHNPVETDPWLADSKTNFKIEKTNVNVLHGGRIGKGIGMSLLEVATAIDEMNKRGYGIKLFIQTASINSRITKMLRKHSSIVINPAADYAQIPKIFSSADILLIANDFGTEGFSFLKLSMPTKATEYMISGTPVLVYAPEESAISRLFQQNECGLCVSEHKIQAITEGLKYLIDNENFRKRISRNAVNLVKEKYDAKMVREKFQNIMQALNKTGR